jgi:hypothetical protein
MLPLLAAALAAPLGLQGEDALALLSDRCFACHGPDAEAREAGLRLDTREGAAAVLVPGDATGSELVERIRSKGEGRMPPLDSGLSLSDAEVATLVAWVEAGAPWRGHWAFEPVGVSAPPAHGNPEWARSPIDAFVLAPLEADRLAPSEDAEPHELVRRLYLDLTGLPPTQAELDDALQGTFWKNYPRLVERLLASPRYGERMAWDWLEWSRYADTDGYQADPTRQSWPWRDWLVGAFNENRPFDELTVELLAGDLLPNATPEQILASAFNRHHPTNGEGGRIFEETRVENVFDRVETTATVWMGLTMECARCHDHKYDPISQEEYYGLFDFFNQTSDTGRGSGGRERPTLTYLSPEQRALTEALQAEQRELAEQSRAPEAELDATQVAWEEQLRTRLREDPRLAEPLEWGPWVVSQPFPAVGGNASGSFAHAYGPESAVEEDELARVLAGGQPASALPAWHLEPGLADGEVFELPADLGAVYLTRTVRAATDRGARLSLGSDDALRVWLDGVEVLSRNVARGAAPDQESLELDLTPGEHRLVLKIVNTGGRSGVYFRVAEERVLGLTPPTLAALSIPAPERGPQARAELRTFFRRRSAPWWEANEARRSAIRQELETLRGSAPVVMVMDQLAQRRTTRLLERGGYDQPRHEVQPGVPAFLPPLPEGAPRNRLTLARWLVSGEHPLTARVTVNRVWQRLFGRGLVATPEDFGRQGEAPSHPELLDHLARRFVESGWDLKALHRDILLSSTYRQSSRVQPWHLEEDPSNARLTRQSRHRLPSWMLRDQALALSGLLVGDLGGSPVRPYQPEGVWAEATFGTIRYNPDSGDALYRRSLYVFWRRIVGPTVFFDGAKRQTCEVRPSRASSPLHALTTLNETAYVEAARKLGERALAAADGTRAQLAWAFRAATARAPKPEELAILEGRHAEALEWYDAHPGDADALLAVGASPVESSASRSLLAAHAVVCGVLLNLDEVLTRP